MSSAGGDRAGDYVPSEVLERLVEDLTVEDVRLARAEYPEGDPMRGFASVFYAARRLGETREGEEAGSFLGRVRLRDLTPILSRAAETLGNAQGDTSSSPTSADTGA